MISSACEALLGWKLRRIIQALQFYLVFDSCSIAFSNDQPCHSLRHHQHHPLMRMIAINIITRILRTITTIGRRISRDLFLWTTLRTTMTSISNTTTTITTMAHHNCLLPRAKSTSRLPFFHLLRAIRHQKDQPSTILPDATTLDGDRNNSLVVTRREKLSLPYLLLQQLQQLLLVFPPTSCCWARPLSRSCLLPCVKWSLPFGPRRKPWSVIRPP